MRHGEGQAVLALWTGIALSAGIVLVVAWSLTSDFVHDVALWSLLGTSVLAAAIWRCGGKQYVLRERSERTPTDR
jgi:hypothetical protein